RRSMNGRHAIFIVLVAAVAACGMNEGQIGGAAAGGTRADASAGGRDGSADATADTVHAPPGQPPGWSEGLALREAKDRNPDPRIFEIALEARIGSASFIPGTTTPVWTYDGGVPGPLLRVKVGLSSSAFSPSTSGIPRWPH